MVEIPEPDAFPGGRRDIKDHPGFQWFVATICTGTACASALTGKLDAAGYPVYLPSLVKTTHYAKVSLCKRLPLFPGYMFVAFDTGNLPDMQEWRHDGMGGLLMRAGLAGVPFVIPALAIEALRSAEDSGVLRDVTGTPARSSLSETEDEMKERGLEQGSHVSMNPDSLFYGMAAVLKAAEPDMRITLLMDILGRQTLVKDVPLDHVEPVTPSPAPPNHL